MAASGIAVLPSLRIGVTSTGSHLTGACIPSSASLFLRTLPAQNPLTFAAEKMSLTDWEISGPIPSPSMMVTVYFPCIQSVSVSFSLALSLSTSPETIPETVHRYPQIPPEGLKKQAENFRSPTYISTLLALELGHTLVSRRSIATELNPTHTLAIRPRRRRRRITPWSPSYLRNRRNEARSHPC